MERLQPSTKEQIIKAGSDYSVQISQKPGEHIGSIMWKGSLALCQFLLEMATSKTPEPQLVDFLQRTKSGTTQTLILELGAGVGTAGIFSGRLFPNCKVVLTDREVVIPLLKMNVDANSSLSPSGGFHVSIFEWGSDSTPVPHQWPDLVLAADVM